MGNDVRLREPLSVTGDDVERALFEQSMDELAVAHVFHRLRGIASERAAEELNRALEVNIFDVLSEGWAKVPGVRNAIQLSGLAKGPPALVNLDWHNIVSKSHVVLDASVAETALPPLNLTLEIVASIQSAALAARDGRVELFALGDASVVARLKYKSVLLKEHATSISGAPRDPFKRQTSIDRQASIDIQI